MFDTHFHLIPWIKNQFQIAEWVFYYNFFFQNGIIEKCTVGVTLELQWYLFSLFVQAGRLGYWAQQFIF